MTAMDLFLMFTSFSVGFAVRAALSLPCLCTRDYKPTASPAITHLQETDNP